MKTTVTGSSSSVAVWVKRYDAVLFLFLCSLIFWVPLPGASARYWSMMGWSACIFGLFLLWSIGFAFGWFSFSQAVKKARMPLFLLSLVPVWMWLQSSLNLEPFNLGWSLEKSASGYMSLLSAAFCALFFLLLQLLNQSRVKALLILVFAVVVIQALYGVMMVLTGIEYAFFVPKQYFRGFATGTFVNPNHFAAFINLGLSIGVASLMISIKELDGKKNLVSNLLKLMASGSLAWRMALIICVIALVMSSSRMANLAFVFAIVSTTLMHMLIKRRVIWVWVWLIVSIFLIDALVIGARFGVDRVVSAVSDTVIGDETRSSLFSMALPMVRDYFWLGTGAGSFYSVFPAYSQGNIGGDFYYHLHNDYLEFLIELGLIGTLPIVLFVLCALRAAYFAIKLPSKWSQIAGFASLMAMASIAFHSLADFSLRIPAYAAVLICIMTIPYIYQYSGDEPLKKRRRRRRK